MSDERGSQEELHGFVTVMGFLLKFKPSWNQAWRLLPGLPVLIGHVRFTSCSPPCPMSADRCLENGWLMSSMSLKMDAQSRRTEQGSLTECTVMKREVTQWAECGSGARSRKDYCRSVEGIKALQCRQKGSKSDRSSQRRRSKLISDEHRHYLFLLAMSRRLSGKGWVTCWTSRQFVSVPLL